MKPPADPELIDLLNAALCSAHGVAIATSDPVLLRQRLYVARQGLPEYNDLSLSIGPTNPGELWIIRLKESQGQLTFNQHLS